MSHLKIKRIYEEPEPGDGYRVLVDRLWPRGLKKEDAHLDAWLKDVAPSPGLRTWWHHDPDTMPEFAERYQAELEGNPAVEDLLKTVGSDEPVTLLYAAKDTRINHAAVLADYLTGSGESGSPGQLPPRRSSSSGL